MAALRLVGSTAAFGGLITLAVAVSASYAQRDVRLLDPVEAAAQLERATKQSENAAERAQQFAATAEEASAAADKTASEAAAIAAQIQQSEADIKAAEARYSLARNARTTLSTRLAKRQQPLVRLTGALQTSARRPLTLSALQPGSLKELVYVRAVLASAVPEIRARTGTLRRELERGKELESGAANALESLRTSEIELARKRDELADLEAEQRLASSEARSNAVRINERALALAEEARDLDGLVKRLDEAAALRRTLAALPGPVMRPANLSASQEIPLGDAGQVVLNGQGAEAIASSDERAAAPQPYQLPVGGRIITGFGEAQSSGLRSKGLEMSTASSGQVVSPGAGRVAFAGPYRGYGRIVIIEHEGGWTSLVTGLERTDIAVGEDVISGSPLGVAAGTAPLIALELRKSGEPVNPLQFVN
ncbi:MAG: peptidoglycan DD-metalloendopeptidase family protein [Pseudomonadota bacterium]